jgi:hypothetical protein
MILELIRAEALKLVRRRGLMIWQLVLTVGVVLVAEIVLVALHAANAAKHGPAGGATNLEHLVDLLTGLGGVAAVILGATAGSQDVSNGVFRDLVVTGRSRATLFNVRVPGAALVFYPMLAVGFAVAIGGSFLLAGSAPSPARHDIGDYLLYAFAITFVNLVIAIGLASFAPSRVVVGVLIAWNTIGAHLLIAIKSLGGARSAIDIAAAEHFAPSHMIDNGVAMSTATALIVLAAWLAVFLRAGRFWTVRRDV